MAKPSDPAKATATKLLDSIDVIPAEPERLNIDAVVISTLFEEARQADTREDLLSGLSVGLARLEATGAFSKLDRSVEEVRLENPTVVGGSHGLKLRIGAKPFKYNMQVGAKVNARGETEAFTELRLPNLTGHLDALTLRLGEDQGDLLADTASFASGGSSTSSTSSGGASIGGGRGQGLLRARQASPWIQALYTKPTVAGTRWSLEAAAKQSATSWDARQSLRLRERQASITLTDPSGKHTIGATLSERRPRLSRLPGPVGAGLPPSDAKTSPAVKLRSASDLLGTSSPDTSGAAGSLFATSASERVAMESGPSLKGALVYGYAIDTRPRVAAGAPCSGSRLSVDVELAGLPGMSSVSHAKARIAASNAFSIGRYAADTGFALPPTSSQRASPATLAKLRSQAQQQGLRPHPGPCVIALGQLNPARSGQPRPTIASLSLPATPQKAQLIPSRLSLEPRAPASGWRETVAGWLAPGITVATEVSAGVMTPLPASWGLQQAWRGITAPAGSVSYAPGESYRPDVMPASAADLAAEPSRFLGQSSIVDRFQLGSPALRGYASEGIGPRGTRVGGGSDHGDSLGGDLSFAAGMRILGPPPLPSVTLVNAGVRTHAWANAGVLLPGPLRSLSPVITALADSARWSAAAGVGVSVPMGGLANLELNYTLAHSGPATDLKQFLSMTFSA